MKFNVINKKLCRNILFSIAASLVIVTPASAGHLHSNQGPSGGIGGRVFHDLCRSNERIHQLRIRSGGWLDAIQVACINKVSGAHRFLPKRGGNGGSQKIINLANNEHISSVTGYYNKYVRSLRIRTSLGKTYNYGIPNGRYFAYNEPKGDVLIGLLGAAGRYVDSIGTMWR